MDVVIQCAATKSPQAGTFRATDGRKVWFVAQPEFSRSDNKTIFAHPDEDSDVPNMTWRSRLTEYVAKEGHKNPYGLLKAYQLYTHRAYAALVKTFGEQHVFVLSAGWGLIRADYLTPTYDVTFNRRAKIKKPEAFVDSKTPFKYFQQIPKDKAPIIFLGGKDYLPLFDNLTANILRKRIVFVRSREPQQASPQESRAQIRFVPFPVAAKTNWHYQCAMALADGRISLEEICDDGNNL